MRQWREFVPKSPDDVQDERFIYALHHHDWAEWLCDEFIREDRSGKLAMRGIIKTITEINRKAVHKAPP